MLICRDVGKLRLSLVTERGQFSLPSLPSPVLLPPALPHRRPVSHANAFMLHLRTTPPPPPPLPPRGNPSGLRKRESDDDARGTAAEDQNERATGGASRRASERASSCVSVSVRARARRDPRRARPLAEAAETRASIGQGGARDRGRQRDKTATIYSCGAVRSYPEVFPLGAE